MLPSQPQLYGKLRRDYNLSHKSKRHSFRNQVKPSFLKYDLTDNYHTKQDIDTTTKKIEHNRLVKFYIFVRKALLHIIYHSRDIGMLF